MNIGHIAGGTNAGWRRTKPAPKPWACACGPQKAYLVSCSTCKAERPE